MTKKKLQVNIDLTKKPEIYQELMVIVKENESTPPRIALKFILEGLKRRNKRAVTFSQSERHA